MRAFAVAVIMSASTAYANAEAQAPPAPSAGFTDPQAFCADKIRNGSTCSLEWPPTSARGVVRSAVFANVDGSWQLLVQTSRGWFGRSVLETGAGDSVTIDLISIADRVFDTADDLYVEFTEVHAGARVDDGPTFATTYAMVCVVLEGVPRCTEPIVRGVNFQGAEIQRYRSEWTFDRKGGVTRTLRDVFGITKSEQRQLTTPFHLRFGH